MEEQQSVIPASEARLPAGRQVRNLDSGQAGMTFLELL